MQPKAYRNYLLVVLLVIYAFNGVDGLALALMLQDIKTDLHLSDAELGVLTGIAFALFYSVLGVPIARWADRGNRVLIIAVTTALWCGAVALSSVARNFSELLGIRILVAIGEAGCIAPAQSLIADYFPRAERPRAVGIYLMGSSLSVVVGFFLAGWLNELVGWRATFRLLGLPGLIVAGVAWFTLREPRLERAVPERGERRPRPLDHSPLDAPGQVPSLREVARTLYASRTFRHLLLGFSVASFFASGVSQWQPSFFIRSYGFNTGELGTWFTGIFGAGGLLGIYLGGELATRFARNDEALQLRAIAVLYGLFGVVSTGIYLASSAYWAFALTALAFLGGAATAAPLFAVIQTLVPDNMRATTIAVLYLFSNLVGLGLGPLAVGALSNEFSHWLGAESLRYALLAVSPGYLWVTWHLWRASTTVACELAPRAPVA